MGDTLTYFMQSSKGGPVKIGKSSSFEQRLRTIAAVNPEGVVVLGVIHGDAEAILHAKFRKQRLRGEWFFPSQKLLRFIQDYAHPYVREEKVAIKKNKRRYSYSGKLPEWAQQVLHEGLSKKTLRIMLLNGFDSRERLIQAREQEVLVMWGMGSSGLGNLVEWQASAR
jgi:hypothetical protein